MNEIELVDKSDKSGKESEAQNNVKKTWEVVIKDLASKLNRIAENYSINYPQKDLDKTNSFNFFSTPHKNHIFADQLKEITDKILSKTEFNAACLIDLIDFLKKMNDEIPSYDDLQTEIFNGMCNFARIYVKSICLEDFPKDSQKNITILLRMIRIRAIVKYMRDDYFKELKTNEYWQNLITNLANVQLQIAEKYLKTYEQKSFSHSNQGYARELKEVTQKVKSMDLKEAGPLTYIAFVAILYDLKVKLSWGGELQTGIVREIAISCKSMKELTEMFIDGLSFDHFDYFYPIMLNYAKTAGINVESGEETKKSIMEIKDKILKQEIEDPREEFGFENINLNT